MSFCWIDKIGVGSVQRTFEHGHSIAWSLLGVWTYTLIHTQRAHVTRTYNVINTSPKMATNTTHLTDLLTSAAMSSLDLSNKSVRHLLV